MVSVLDLCERWDLVTSDFASEYGVRLARTDLSWREFKAYLAGLLAADTRIYRAFAVERSEPEAGVDDGGW